ncbi:chorismate mutase [Streptomyces abyssalis]|uniref:Chorismate mutase n=1 Tax=Streptomyces abyssalis TaxID=933944 RepID=A0A1E7JFP6_9ACTN|nr:chorismate mutase [Streptomyces abyssalis]OEU85296.1 chorismate mutase [Streptomyces abyssalis]OEU91536.1 chorismate mutase [Streptomyces abyssalis]OEV09194.1 chorismate mutase [Streptomyces nanshensis]
MSTETARTTPRPATPGTGEDGESGDATAGATAAARSRIDELDGRIIALVQERRTVSAGIQRARVEAGGRRVELAREMEILDRYRGELGRPGTQLAMTLLALCRGQL